MRTFPIEIVTPEGLKLCDEIESLLVRTDDGDVEILAGHADLIASVSNGRIRIIEDGGEKRFGSVNGGLLSIIDGKVRLCVIEFKLENKHLLFN